jgi:hypothetical protein
MLDYLTAHAGDILTIASYVIAAAAAIAALTPTPADDGVLKVIRKLIDWAALNVGNAKNQR